ncbi:MAG: hypothetical protein HC808_17445 [Candidatus Competibacteraceae bacterium]|nr:hypothetical protein [Candidatus Competibacteraceae bacterium]
MSNEQSTAILSADYATAERALDEGIKIEDAELIALALNNPHLEIKLRAAEALAELGDKQSIPCLRDALQENQVVYTGGSEAQALQVELNKALITALEKLSGANYGAVDPASEVDIQRVLQTSQ